MYGQTDTDGYAKMSRGENEHIEAHFPVECSDDERTFDKFPQATYTRCDARIRDNIYHTEMADNIRTSRAL